MSLVSIIHVSCAVMCMADRAGERVCLWWEEGWLLLDLLNYSGPFLHSLLLVFYGLRLG